MKLICKHIVLMLLVLLASCASMEKKRFKSANIYINSHLDMSELNRIALLEGMIILGMNPCESIAAVGEPYSLKIVKSGKLPARAAIPDITTGECGNLNGSIIVFYFTDYFQYGKEENYSVVYRDGSAVKIARGAAPGSDSEDQDAFK